MIYSFIEDIQKYFINIYNNTLKKKSILGSHIIVDYSNFSIIDDTNFAHFIFENMKYVINNFSTLKIVHSHLHIFNPNIDEPGFTCVLLLDASHMTAHCYSKKGLLAVDLFTCGNNDTKLIIEKFNNYIIEKYPNINISILNYLDRFISFNK
jgi:S-adenosylmethionine decarboxylase